MSGLAAVLEDHRFVKALARCECGTEMGNRGNRMAEWRAHLEAAVLAWIEERLASDEVREAVARVTCCMVCEGTGLSLQGWTDKGGIPEGQYGPCRDCTAALTAVTAALRGQA